MRLALKNTLFLLAGYGALLLVLAGFAVFQLLMLEARVQKDTARLFAREVAGALTEPSLDRLLEADRGARQNLKTLIEQLTRNSQVVSSISVVDRTGRIVASDERIVGQHRPTPDELLGPNRRGLFVTFGRLPFASGSYELVVPLVRRGERVGYLQIRLVSRSVGEMNRRMWDSLFIAAILGLLCLAGLGFALHVQLSRRGRTLASTLEAAIRGEAPRVTREVDEFSPAIEAAGRAGREISRARAHSVEERGRFATLGQILNVGVLLLDPDGRLEFTSRRARELFGCESDDELGRALAEMAPDFARGMRSPPPGGREGVRIDVAPRGRADGARLRLEIYPLEQGEGRGRLVLVRDRATILALETDLRLASQLKALARLYLSVVHDIRAPLAAVVANLELLNGSFERGAADRNGADDRWRSYLAVVDQEVHRLRRSLDNLLNHTALPRDDLEELDLRDLVVDMEHLLRPQCDRQKVALAVCVPPVAVRVLGTRDALKQALVNIGINALEAMPQGGALDLRLARQDGRATLSVADSGPGIAREVRDRIFSMHFTTKSGGTGIGLYVARAVVESNGGEIRLCSPVGRGATFEIDLPAMATEG